MVSNFVATWLLFFFKVNGKIESAHLKILDFVHGSLRMYPKFIFFLNTGYNFDRCSSVYTRKRTEELLKCFSLCFSIFIQPNHKNQRFYIIKYVILLRRNALVYTVLDTDCGSLVVKVI